MTLNAVGRDSVEQFAPATYGNEHLLFSSFGPLRNIRDAGVGVAPFCNYFGEDIEQQTADAKRFLGEIESLAARYRIAAEG